MNSTVYQAHRLDEIADTDLDFFILATGSDNRAYEVLSKLKLSEKTKLIFVHFDERLNGLNGDDPLLNYRAFFHANSEEFTCSIRDPSSSLERLQNNSFGVNSKIGIDISCFTKPYFFFIIKLLQTKFKVERIVTFYTEPQSYIFPRGLFESFHTNTGPLSIIQLPGFTGYEQVGASRKLVILLGFDGDISEEIEINVSPTIKLVVNGFPAYSPKFKDISLMANEKLTTDTNVKVRYARANNPFEVYNLLQIIKDEGPAGSFINIAPLGTKPMALGACLFALHNPEVRVVYPLPDVYENKYSDMSWNSWRYELPLQVQST